MSDPQPCKTCGGAGRLVVDETWVTSKLLERTIRVCPDCGPARAEPVYDEVERLPETLRHAPLAAMRMAYSGAMYGAGLDRRVRSDIEARVEGALAAVADKGGGDGCSMDADCICASCHPEEAAGA